VCRRLELVGEEQNNKLSGDAVFGVQPNGRRLCSGSARFTNERRGKRGDRVGTRGKAIRSRGQLEACMRRGFAVRHVAALACSLAASAPLGTAHDSVVCEAP
jgi:hypothetical protein